MARRSRAVMPGFPLHITQRGHNREPVFLDEQDFGVFRELALTTISGCMVAIHAYALMTNHVHLLVTADGTCDTSQFMQRVSGRFTQYWNKRHRRSGTLWGGRFHSCIVDTDHYVLACVKYIDLNPMRAGIVAEPQAYAWSSFRALALGEEDALVTPHPAYVALGATPLARSLAYRHYCSIEERDAAARAIRAATRLGGAVGSSTFLDRVAVSVRRPVSAKIRGGDRRSGAWRLVTGSDQGDRFRGSEGTDPDRHQAGGHWLCEQREQQGQTP